MIRLKMPSMVRMGRGKNYPKKVKQALEKRETIVAAIKEIQAIKESDKTGKKRFKRRGAREKKRQK